MPDSQFQPLVLGLLFLILNQTSTNAFCFFAFGLLGVLLLLIPSIEYLVNRIKEK